MAMSAACGSSWCVIKELSTFASLDIVSARSPTPGRTTGMPPINGPTAPGASEAMR
jgi:hypothetical protein